MSRNVIPSVHANEGGYCPTWIRTPREKTNINDEQIAFKCLPGDTRNNCIWRINTMNKCIVGRVKRAVYFSNIRNKNEIITSWSDTKILDNLHMFLEIIKDLDKEMGIKTIYTQYPNQFGNSDNINIGLSDQILAKISNNNDSIYNMRIDIKGFHKKKVAVKDIHPIFFTGSYRIIYIYNHTQAIQEVLILKKECEDLFNKFKCNGTKYINRPIDLSGTKYEIELSKYEKNLLIGGSSKKSKAKQCSAKCKTGKKCENKTIYNKKCYLHE